MLAESFGSWMMADMAMRITVVIQCNSKPPSGEVTSPRASRLTTWSAFQTLDQGMMLAWPMACLTGVWLESTA